MRASRLWMVCFRSSTTWSVNGAIVLYCRDEGEERIGMHGAERRWRRGGADNGQKSRVGGACDVARELSKLEVVLPTEPATWLCRARGPTPILPKVITLEQI